jgi:DNA/RNA-binding domain of Phe-tRNA-synthetase-like protein
MYRRIGWEPTQYRPAAEALIRRILKGTGLYRINNLVDLANIVSTRYHLPMGLYDLHKIDHPIVVDVGRAAESYQGIYKDLIHAEGKMVLRDVSGIFGNPTADSARTCIDSDTRSLVAIFFTPAEIEPSYLDQTLAALAALYQQECPQCTMECFRIKPSSPKLNE